MNAPGWNFVVILRAAKAPQHARALFAYDWCGSIASAIRHLDQRTATGVYAEVYIQRMRMTKGRGRGSRRLLYESDPMLRTRGVCVAKVAA